MALDNDIKNAKPGGDPEEIDEDFRTWPGDGFTISVPSNADLEEMLETLKSIPKTKMVAVPEALPKQLPLKAHIPEPPPLAVKKIPPPAEPVGIPPKPSNKTVKELVGELKEHNKDFAKTVKFPEKDAVNFYKGSGYQEMNGALRGFADFEMYPSLQRKVKEIDKIFERVPALKKDMFVYRGMSWRKATFNLKEFVDKGFISTSLDPAIAEGFASSGGPFTAINMTIKVPAGYKGLWLESVSDMLTGEKEFLLPRGTKFRVLAIEKSGNKIFNVLLEVIS